MTFPRIDQPGYVPVPDAEKRITGRVLTPEMAERLDHIGQNYMTRYMEQCWIENDAEGFTGWRWDKHGGVRRVAAVANRYGTIIVLGTRHYSNLMCVSLDAIAEPEILIKWAGEENYEQGFVDQYGTFLDRKEAWLLAEANNQIVYRDRLPVGTLYSEHLW